MKYDVIIIGAGIAGATCSIYLKRAGKKVLLVEKEAVGGLLNKCYEINNFPGYNKIMGPDFAYNIYNQLRENNIDIIFDEVINISNNEVITKENKYNYDFLVIATGRCNKKITNKNLKTISYCGLCDGALYKAKEVSVVGGGDSAIATTLYLANICRKVNLLSRGNKLKGDAELIKEIRKKENVSIRYNLLIKDVSEKDGLNIITLNNGENIISSALFVCIGYEPSSDLYNVQKENGYILTNEFMQTSEENIYAIGDIRKKDLYQLTTAASDATICANNIINKLNRK